jgi:hypothetical protein
MLSRVNFEIMDDTEQPDFDLASANARAIQSKVTWMRDSSCMGVGYVRREPARTVRGPIKRLIYVRQARGCGLPQS